MLTTCNPGTERVGGTGSPPSPLGDALSNAVPIRLHFRVKTGMGCSAWSAYSAAQLLLPCSHEGHRPQMGGGKEKGGSPPQVSVLPMLCLLAGGFGWQRQEAAVPAARMEQMSPPPPGTTHHPPSLPPPANNTPRGVQSLRVGAKRISPPTPSAGHQGGGWGVTPPRPFTFRCFRGHVPVGSAVPPPPLHPPCDCSPVTGSAYSCCL